MVPPNAAIRAVSPLKLVPIGPGDVLTSGVPQRNNQGMFSKIFDLHRVIEWLRLEGTLKII